jgi:hypothetical protein
LPEKVMAGILLVINSNTEKFPLEFAFYLGKPGKSRLTGLFLESLENIHDPEKIIASKRRFEVQVRKFRDVCDRERTDFAVVRSRALPIHEVIAESRYQDLLLIDPATTFDGGSGNLPTAFVREVMDNAECPVLLAPRGFTEVKEVVFTYTGTRSSVFAIRMFNYLLPFLNHRVHTVHAAPGKTIDSAQTVRFRRWMDEHYPGSGFTALTGEAANGIAEFLKDRPQALVVAGASDRGALSLLVRPSTTERLVAALPNAFFISHY